MCDRQAWRKTTRRPHAMVAEHLATDDSTSCVKKEFMRCNMQYVHIRADGLKGGLASPATHSQLMHRTPIQFPRVYEGHDSWVWCLTRRQQDLERLQEGTITSQLDDFSFAGSFNCSWAALCPHLSEYESCGSNVLVPGD
jgi:hypothetical protein